MPQGMATTDSDVARVPPRVQVGDESFATWPAEHPFRIVQGARIATTRFADAARYHAALLAAVHAAAADARYRDATRTLPWGCGFKVRNLPDWGAPAATLVHSRAVMFAHRISGFSAVYCDESWGNLYRHGEYCAAHAHVRSDVSVVYMVDEGDGDSRDQFSGKLNFLDPRIAWCCSREAGRPTRPFVPRMEPGAMVAFASEYLHAVNPYLGQRPRITLSWNFTHQRLADAGRPRLAVPD